MPLSGTARAVVYGFGFLGVLGAVRAMLGRRTAPAPEDAEEPTPRPAGTGTWVDPDAPRRIRQLASKLGWPGLADFLVAVAYHESRGNSQVQAGSGENAARGWFQIRPTTARLDQRGLPNPGALFDEEAQVAIAADLVERLNRRWAGPGQIPDWLAIRRGWWLPSRLSDVHELKDRSAKIREMLLATMDKVGVPRDLVFQRAVPEGFSWMGFDRALATVRGAVA